MNEKVALEVGAGASWAGARVLVTMKHVGVNVAADPLFTLSYTGVRGGLVLVSADDPQQFSSQNEQDNRHYARFAKVPLLEPADSQEARDFTLRAFELSEEFDTPVMLRTVTRLSHAKGARHLRRARRLPGREALRARAGEAGHGPGVGRAPPPPRRGAHAAPGRARGDEPT